MIDVMIIDDNEALRLGLRIFVEEESDMRVVGKFVSAAVSLSEVEGLKPDVVLLSVGLSDMTGFEACRKILNLAPSTRIVFIGPGHVKQVMVDQPPFPTTLFVVDTEEVEATYVRTVARMSRMSLPILVSCRPVLSTTGILGGSWHPLWEPESPRLALSELRAYQWDSLYHRMRQRPVEGDR